MPRMTVTAALAAILLCGPALGDDAGTDEIRARLLGTPVWVYEWGAPLVTPNPVAPGKVKVGTGKVSFVEKDGKLLGVMDVGLKCSNEVRLRTDGFDFENCRGNNMQYVRSGNEFKNTDGGWYHTFRPAP
jgi:hypothetical protein